LNANKESKYLTIGDLKQLL
jgi:hypothetical protein